MVERVEDVGVWDAALAGTFQNHRHIHHTKLPCHQPIASYLGADNAHADRNEFANAGRGSRLARAFEEVGDEPGPEFETYARECFTEASEHLWGTRNPRRAIENAAAATLRLSEEDLKKIAEVAPPEQWVGDRSSFAVPTTARPAEAFS